MSEEGSHPWVARSLRRLWTELDQARDVLTLARKSVMAAEASAKLVEALATLDDKLAEEFARQDVKLPEVAASDAESSDESVRWRHVEESRRLIPAAQAEVEAGFPFLNGMFLVWLWSVVEAYSRDMLYEWVARCDQVQDLQDVSRLRITVGAMRSWEKQRLARHLVDQAFTQHGSLPPTKRFLRVARTFGIESRHPIEVLNVLDELVLVRNLRVHAAGRLDRATLSACPRLRAIGLTEGAVVPLEGLTEPYSVSCLYFHTFLVTGALRFLEKEEAAARVESAIDVSLFSAWHPATLAKAGQQKS